MKLTKDDIFNSVEYQWRKHQLVLYFYVWLIVSIISIFIPITITITNLEYIDIAILSWLGAIIFMLLIFSTFMLYSYSKMSYLLKNYENMQIYEVNALLVYFSNKDLKKYSSFDVQILLEVTYNQLFKFENGLTEFRGCFSFDNLSKKLWFSKSEFNQTCKD